MPSFFSEIDKQARAVLAHHYPKVSCHGDFTTIRNGDYQPIDLLVGGTPCQSFSVAGLRGGMADARGNLALEYLRLADRTKPRWILWENVPGVLSSGGGRDFGAFLRGLVELGYGFAYRVLDAQYFGLAQRRKRVFVVGYLGDWRRAAAVLFEPAGLRGDTPPRRETRERVAETIGARTGRSIGTQDAECGHITAATIRTREGRGCERGDRTDNLITHTLRSEGFDASEDGTGRGTPLIAVTMRSKGDAHSNGVRRLTPMECCRLQGFPDDYLGISYRGKPLSDGPKYKLLGNSMAVPVMRWIGKRIDRENNRTLLCISEHHTKMAWNGRFWQHGGEQSMTRTPYITDTHALDGTLGVRVGSEVWGDCGTRQSIEFRESGT